MGNREMRVGSNVCLKNHTRARKAGDIDRHSISWLIVFLMILLDGGGIKPRTACFILLFSFISLACIVRRRGCLLAGNKQSFVWTGVILGSGFISIVVGIDRGESIYGVIRLTAFLSAEAALHQMEKFEREFLLATLPIIGVFFLAGCFLHSISLFGEWVSATGRFSGPFGYANTMALFLVLGIIAAEHLYCRWRRVIQFILATGVFGTGSRTVFVVLCGYVIFRFLKHKDKNKYIVLVLLCMIGLAWGIGITGRSVYGTARVLKLDINSSTLQGRFLYWEDAVRMLIKHPAGLGYMGYFYLQQAEQTGVYSVRFVHNEWLQWLLDYGIAAGIGLAGYLFSQCKRGHMLVMEKELLCVIAICSIFDFHLQFWSITFLVLLLIPGDGTSKSCRRRNGRLLGLGAGIVISMGLCITAYMADYYAGRGDYARAVRWNPFSAQYKQEYLLQSPDLKTAEACADQQLEDNRYLYAAYLIKSNAAAQEERLGDFIANRQKVLRLRKYEIKEYEDYFQILFGWYLRACEEKNMQEMDQCVQEMKEIPEWIVKVKRQTSLRAYRIQDKPNLNFDRKYINIIETLEENTDE